MYTIILDEGYDATTIKPLVCGVSNDNFVEPVPNPPVPGSFEDRKLNRNNGCKVNQIAGPGNLGYVDGHDALLIGTLVINIGIATKKWLENVGHVLL